MYVFIAWFFMVLQKAFHSVDDLLEAAAEQDKLEPPAKKIAHSSAENLTAPVKKSKGPPPAPLKRPPKTAPKTPQKKGEQLISTVLPSILNEGCWPNISLVWIYCPFDVGMR
jgi:hypothetical protein